MPARRALTFLLAISAALPAAAAESPPSPAQVLWLHGQKAMRDGDTQKAIEFYSESLKLEPALACNHLSLAAGYVALAEHAKAAHHLAQYLDAEPDHHTVRVYYAEILLRLDQFRDARIQFERFIANIQDKDELARQHLVHCHSRLMEIAEKGEDAYAEHLHRGIGLFHLGLQRARLGEEDGELSPESLLCQAAGELTLARLERPGAARPCWYLHEVWARLAQAQPAKRWLRAAEAVAPFNDLTPHEQAQLQLACRQLAHEGSRK